MKFIEKLEINISGTENTNLFGKCDFNETDILKFQIYLYNPDKHSFILSLILAILFQSLGYAFFRISNEFKKILF